MVNATGLCTLCKIRHQFHHPLKHKILQIIDHAGFAILRRGTTEPLGLG